MWNYSGSRRGMQIISLCQLQAEKHSEVDKAWELKLSKKYNDLAGGRAQTTLKFQDVKRPAVWEAAYPDQNTPHAFTGLLQRFQYPMGDCNHEILCTVMPNVCLVRMLEISSAQYCCASTSGVSGIRGIMSTCWSCNRCFYVRGGRASITCLHQGGL